MKREFSEAGLIRLNELVKAVRRQPNFRDIYGSVEPPQRKGSPPILRLELSGTVEVTPLNPRTVEHMLATGHPGPILIEIKQAFNQLNRTVQRHGRKRLPDALRKSYL